jgi:twinkle protein
MNVRDDSGRLIAQKFRTHETKGQWIGDAKNPPLYGQWLWGKGKSVVITEGELDAMSVSQAFENKYPVVSLPNGTGSVSKAIPKAYDWLNRFDTIVLMFDMDEPGREAVEKAASLLPVGKVKIATLPHKDANETLLKEGPGPIIKAYWNAKPWRPDGIRSVSDIREDYFNRPPEVGVPYPWNSWNERIRMMRLGELVTFTAGSGIGKSTLARELIKWLAIDHEQPVGVMMLEESNVDTMDGLCGVLLNKNVLDDPSCATKEELEYAFAEYERRPVFIYDHFGSSEVDNICNRIRYLVQACGVKYVFLDHLSIVVSGLEGDERRTIDIAMTKLRTLVSELGCWLGVIVHLRRPMGDKGHEDGAKISLGQLRGSHSIVQLSNTVIGLQKPEDDPDGTSVEPVALKVRRGGRKGSMGLMNYNYETGRYEEGMAL